MAGKKLLVVDDSLTIQKVIRLALSNEGYEIQACSDGSEAIQQLSLFRPDIALIDVSLPSKTAFEIKAEVNKDHDLSKIRFVLMSSAFEQVDEAAVEKVGFHARLIKPFDPAHLRQVLVDTLSASSAETESKPSIKLQDDLWTPDENQAPPPAHFDSLGAGQSSDNDIRTLTEATIKMSGLDDFEWSMNETGKKLPPDEPALKPYPGHSDLGDPSFRFDPENPPEEKAYGNLPLTPPPPKEAVQKTETHSSVAASMAQVAPVSEADVEEAVRKHLENTLERMAQKMLPDIAEKVIKQEIHRMLSEMP